MKTQKAQSFREAMQQYLQTKADQQVQGRIA